MSVAWAARSGHTVVGQLVVVTSSDARPGFREGTGSPSDKREVLVRASATAVTGLADRAVVRELRDPGKPPWRRRAIAC